MITQPDEEVIDKEVRVVFGSWKEKRGFVFAIYPHGIFHIEKIYHIRYNDSINTGQFLAKELELVVHKEA